MNNNTELEITGCQDCVFSQRQPSGRFQCVHPFKTGNAYIFWSEDHETLATPFDCPLKQSSLTISIKQ